MKRCILSLYGLEAIHTHTLYLPDMNDFSQNIIKEMHMSSLSPHITLFFALRSLEANAINLGDRI